MGRGLHGPLHTWGVSDLDNELLNASCWRLGTLQLSTCSVAGHSWGLKGTELSGWPELGVRRNKFTLNERLWGGAVNNPLRCGINVVQGWSRLYIIQITDYIMQGEGALADHLKGEGGRESSAIVFLMRHICL
jgi:hypothetical protein